MQGSAVAYLSHNDVIKEHIFKDITLVYRSTVDITSNRHF